MVNLPWNSGRTMGVYRVPAFPFLPYSTTATKGYYQISLERSGSARLILLNFSTFFWLHIIYQNTCLLHNVPAQLWHKLFASFLFVDYSSPILLRFFPSQFEKSLALYFKKQTIAHNTYKHGLCYSLLKTFITNLLAV